MQLKPFGEQVAEIIYSTKFQDNVNLLTMDRDKTAEVISWMSLHALKNERHFHGGNLAGWLYFMARNQVFSERRTKYRRVVGHYNDAQWAAIERHRNNIGASNAEFELKYDIIEPVRAAARLLPAKNRLAIELSLDGYLNREAAELTGVAKGTLSHRIYDAKPKLRAILTA